MTQRTNKRSNDSVDDSERKRQRLCEELTSTIEFTHPTPTVNPHSEFHIPHKSTLPITLNGPRIDTAPATHDQEQITAKNADRTSPPAYQSHTVTIPSKRTCPFGKNMPKKKRRKEGLIVRIYEEGKDLQHTDEIECILTPEGGLDLAVLAQKLNVNKCQVSPHHLDL